MKLVDVNGDFSIPANDGTQYSLVFCCGNIAVVNSFGSVIAEFDTDDMQEDTVCQCGECKHWKGSRPGMFGVRVGECHNEEFPFHCENIPLTKETDFCNYFSRKKDGDKS